MHKKRNDCGFLSGNELTSVVFIFGRRGMNNVHGPETDNSLGEIDRDFTAFAFRKRTRSHLLCVGYVLQFLLCL